MNVFAPIRGFLAVLLVLGFLGLPAGAQTAIPENTILTQGRGEVVARPDSLNVSVSVESQAATLAEARRDNNTKMEQIRTALRGLDIPNLKLETQQFQVSLIHEAYSDSSRARMPRIIGYRVYNNLLVKVTGATPEALGEYGTRILDTALNSGANNVGGLNFYVERMDPLHVEAMKAAVVDARRYAEAMAEAAGLTLTGVYSMEGYPQFSGPQPIPMMMRGAVAEMSGVPDTPIEIGETTITSTVTVRFQFNPLR